MSILIRKIICLLITVFLFACQTGLNSAEEMYKWMNNPSNGLIMTKQSANKELTMKYLPPDYLVYNEVKENKNPDKVLIDSLRKIYTGSRSFLLTIKYKNNEPYDPLYEDIGNYGELDSRKKEMQFSFEQYVKLITEQGKEYHPVLAHMEETYGLQKCRNIYLVFSPKNKQETDILESEELDIVFDDRIFNTGINHFVYEKNSIDKPLKLNFL